MGAEEIHWGFSEINDLDLLQSKLNMSTKLNHKNGDKTMSEDLLIEKEDKIACEEGQGICAHLLIVGSILLIIVTFPLSLCFVVKVVQVKYFHSYLLIFRTNNFMSHDSWF